MDRFREREERAFLRSGIVASVIANGHRDPKSDPFTPQDFMPSTTRKDETPRQPTREEWLAGMRALNASFGGEDLTQNA